VTAVGLVPRRTPASGERRRAWLLAAVVGLVVLIYLVSWSVYALAHTGDDRYRVVGATATAQDAEWRLVSLVQATQLATSSTEPSRADAGATYVVARLERTPLAATDFASCTTALLGPGGRLWEPASYDLHLPARDASSCSSEDREVGRTYRFEVVYVVPAVFVDRLVGIALPDRTTVDRTAVLQPPA
jgi:hypothetical protein